MLIFVKNRATTIVFVALAMGMPFVANAHHGTMYTPIEREPAEIPRETYQSGYCCMVYDIRANGTTKNIKAQYCTESYLKSPSKAAVAKWRYEKRKKDGTSVKTKFMETTISFYMSDSLGNLVPGKHDFLRMIDGEINKDTPCGELIS